MKKILGFLIMIAAALSAHGQSTIPAGPTNEFPTVSGGGYEKLNARDDWLNANKVGVRATTDLASGTALTIGTDYFDDFSAARTLTFSGTPSAGDTIRLSANVTSSSVVLTVPTSYRLGAVGSSTSVTLEQGNHELNWLYVDSKWWLADTAAGAIDAGDVASGTFADARIAESNVTQHEGALTISESQISDLPGQVSAGEITAGTETAVRRFSPANVKAFVDTHAGGGGDLSSTDIDTLAELNAILTDATLVDAAHNHAASDVTSGTFDDARIAQSNVKQHEGSLSITESQISDFGTYQVADADLTALAALTSTDTLYYRSGADTWSSVAIGANLTFSGGTLAASGGSGGGAAIPIFVVAASDAYDGSGADYTCDGIDDHVQIQAAIDAAAAAGGGIVQLTDGTFTTTDSIVPDDYVWLRGAGWQTVIEPNWSSGGSAVQLARTVGNPLTEFWLTDLKIDCVNASAGSYTPSVKGVFIQYQLRCLFRNLWVDESYATGIGIDFLVDSWIDQCLVTNAGRGLTGAESLGAFGGNGIGIGTGRYATESLIISNCIVRDGHNNGIMFETQTGGAVVARHMQVINSIMEGNWVGARISGVEDVTYTACRMVNSRPGGYGVFLSDDLSGTGILTKRLKIADSTIYGNTIGVSAKSGLAYEDIAFEDCDVSNNTEGYRLTAALSNWRIVGGSAKNNIQSGIDALSLTDCQIIGLEADGNGEANIKLAEAVRVVIRGGSANDSTAEVGIEIDGVSGPLTVSDLEIAGNNGHGLYLRNPNLVSIQDCEIRSNGEAGVYVTTDAASGRLRIAGNRVSNNGQGASGYTHGVVFLGSGALSNSVVEGNQVWDDQGTQTQGYGLVLNSSNRAGLIVRDNDLRGNGTGAYTSSTAGAVEQWIGNTGMNPLGSEAITVGASPYTYTAGPSPEVVYIFSGTVSDVSRGGSTVADSTGAQVTLAPNEAVTVTYSSAPTMRKDRL